MAIVIVAIVVVVLIVAALTKMRVPAAHGYRTP